jgi:hypothetical protein
LRTLLIEAAFDRMPFHFLLAASQPISQTAKRQRVDELANLLDVAPRTTTIRRALLERAVQSFFEIGAFTQNEFAQPLDEVEIGSIRSPRKRRQSLRGGAHIGCVTGL